MKTQPYNFHTHIFENVNLYRKQSQSMKNINSRGVSEEKKGTS
jgi:hypothetical protein